jgi:colicin import membrane protein
MSTKLKLRAVIGAVLVHVAIIALLVISFSFSSHKTAGPQPKVINAVAVDAKQVEQEMNKLQAAEQRKQQEKARKLREAEQARKKEQQRLAELRTKREKERQQRLEAQKKEKQRLAKLA